MNCVLNYFKDFHGCILTELRYDKKLSDEFIKDYYVHSMDDKTAIILFCNYDVYPCGENNFEEAQTYTDWNWILRRDNMNNEWQVADCGY